jgi:micrococcal nuclease
MVRSSAVLLVVAAAALVACTPGRRPAPEAGGTGPTVGAADVATAATPGTAEGASAASANAAPDVSHRAGNRGEVVRVVDGDTLIVRLAGDDERVRLIGIDTPESVKPDSPVECYGHEASDRLAELLPARSPVELVRDAEARDDYDRLLAYVFREPDDLFVNLAMVADGFANALTIAPNTTFADDFDRAAGAARASRLGLWGACPDPSSLFGSVTRR